MITDNDQHFQDVKKEIADEILTYLLSHPKGKDTLEGIAEWWLEMHYIEHGVELVSKALSHLCSHGIVSEKPHNGGHSYYQLNTKLDVPNSAENDERWATRTRDLWSKKCLYST